MVCKEDKMKVRDVNSKSKPCYLVFPRDCVHLQRIPYSLSGDFVSTDWSSDSGR